MSITNLTMLRKDLFNTVENVIEYDEPVTISTKKRKCCSYFRR